MKVHFEMLAAYNAWANERLYDVVAALPAGEFRADRGGSLGSICGRLNHLLAGDLTWMHRFTGEGGEPPRPDAILHDDLDALRAARRAEDARIIAYIDSLTDPDLLGVLRYRTDRQAAPIEDQLAAVIIIFFNDQTHYRGELRHLLQQITGTMPSFDLLDCLGETGFSVMQRLGGAEEMMKMARAMQAMKTGMAAA